MKKRDTGLWLVMAVALGLFAYSLVSIFVNGFKVYKIYPLLLGIINLIGFFMVKK